jgi:hypothetical protein
MAKPETILHRTVADWLRVALRPPSFFTTFPAGGGGKVRGAQLKRLGLVAGVPDILVMHPIAKAGSEYGCWLIGIELKSPKGRQSDEQKVVAHAFEQAGGFYHIARSVDEVEAILREYAIPLYCKLGAAA